MNQQITSKNKSELAFEKEVVEYLTNIGGVKQWEYREDIKTTEQLWKNFKKIIEQNNMARLEKTLSETEFNQVKKIISAISTPYQAGQFLYGVNGVAEIEITLDDGKNVFLTVFDQAQVGGGSTVYQVVNQIKRERVIDGKKNRKFDVTLLINGLPIIQIELKKATHNAKEAINQMEQYIAEKQYSDIFSTLQILIAMTPYEIKYMANTTEKDFNRAFAFNWQNEDDAVPVRSWRVFADNVLSIPMAHNLATQYMVLDGTKNKENIKVMRPYQVYATKRVIEKARAFDFKYDDGKLGYIWHTTGSGKTITSFKTAWLMSRLPNVEKVVFLVDRIALTKQTTDAYKAYDPIAGFEGKTGVINDTANISDLHAKISGTSDQNIIVTSIQKMSRYVEGKYFQQLNKNILFIVDEAHRSTSGSKGGTQENNKGMLESIRNAIPNSGWIGYTGTPKFPETREIFGMPLHKYTIKEAIADRNVLGFKVEFKETIQPPANPTEDDIDDNIRGSVYDISEKHVELVVKDVLDNWKERSNNYKYNALFTVHVGGRGASIPRAMEYFDAFVEANKNREKPLKIAISFSVDTSNGDQQKETNRNLHRAIDYYNSQFGTEWDMKSVRSYTNDLTERLNKSVDDRNYLDLVIVVDQLLTGFDAPELNTLYIDRTLKGANLIQAYSRTNRIHDSIQKPKGNIVNYRWPKQNEYAMDKALALYSNRNSDNEQLSLEVLTEKQKKELRENNIAAGIIAQPFSVIEEQMTEIVEELAELTNSFATLPASEKKQERVFEKLLEYNKVLSQLKQYTEDDDKNPISVYDNPSEFYERIGISEEQEIMLTTVLAGELKELRAKEEQIDISHVNLEMVHIQEIEINYDYLVELIAKMADEVHYGEGNKAYITEKEIYKELAKSDNIQRNMQIRSFVEKILDGKFIFETYPVPRNAEKMEQAMEESQKKSNLRDITIFIREWGLDDTISPQEFEKLVEKHQIGQEDLDKQGELTEIMNKAKDDYKKIASEEIANLSWVRYRIQLRKAFYVIADKIVSGI